MSGSRHILAAHLRRHARMLHRVACGFGRRRDADDIIQTLYTRWWQRMRREPSWEPPEEAAALFVCVKRVVLDEIDKEQRHNRRVEASAAPHRRRTAPSPEDAVDAMARLEWIVARLPHKLASALQARLAAGRLGDARVAAELGVTHAAFTARLFKARRAAEELALYHDVLSVDQANLMAELRYGGQSPRQLAQALGVLEDEVVERRRCAQNELEQHRRAQDLARGPKRTA